MEFSTAILLNHPSGNQIRVDKHGNICLTDMASCFPDKDIRNWIDNKQTLQFVEVWERKNNPKWISFKWVERGAFKNEVKEVMTFKRLASQNSISIISKQGRYGGTYAHKHIAFEFAMWLSAEFKLWVIEEFDRLSSMKHDWDFKRYLASQGYKLQTSAIKDKSGEFKVSNKRNVYAEEADMLNMIVFGKIANGINQRETATPEQLQLLGELEGKNAAYIEANLPRMKRYEILMQAASKFRKLLK